MYPVSKRMIALLRHGTFLRQEDGAIEFLKFNADFKSAFPNSVRWPLRIWIHHLQKGGGRKKIFQFCTDFIGSEILYFRAIQDDSGEILVDPSLLDNVLIPDNFFEFVYHVGSYFNMHSINTSGLVGRRIKSWKMSANGFLYSRGSHGQEVGW